ncbi:MAG: GNAT family N-acetyltransferase, partial [Muricoprocola sp.]
FIEEDYWKKNYEMVRELIPEAEVFVAEENQKIQGFIGLTDDYIAGIFVKAEEQSKGIGSELIYTAMTLKDYLYLNVYRKNTGAVEFYQRCGFIIVNQEIDEDTSEEEYTMEWHR